MGKERDREVKSKWGTPVSIITLTNRGLLRAVLVAFVLLLACRFLAVVTTTVLLLTAALLLA